ncbi:Vacuolar protein sorting-associated protein 55, partial [Lobulomyces angularis]
MAGFKTIISLSLILSIGILMSILSCALYNNWFPLFTIVAYLLAPFPNLICKRIAEHGGDFGSSNETDGILETGYFMT